jgi:hypothetical protein
VSAYDAAGNESPRSTAVVVAVAQPATGTNLLGYWKFDEGRGTIAADSSPHGHHGTIHGATWVPGRIGPALAFDGVNSYVQVARDPSLDSLSGLTMAGWIYPRAYSHWHVLDKGDGDKRLYSEGGASLGTLDGRIRYSGTHALSHSVNNTIRLNGSTSG